jgi:phosphoglucosamine mutase
MRKYFGTDGIRGRVGEDMLTPAFIQDLGRAVGTVFNGKKNIFIARDPRISGDMLQAALSAGICSTGASVCDLGILPTPVCAFLTKQLNADAGIVISASHNPYYDNGIKFFNSTGNKLSDTQELSLENVLTTNNNQKNSSSVISPNRIGKIFTDYSLVDLYINYCTQIIYSLNNQENLDYIKNLKVIVDCSHGAMYKIAPEVLARLGVNLTIINNEPNGLNINQDCGAACEKGLNFLSRLVKKNNADLGIAFDGDGDRVILVNSKGEIIDGDQILYILACERIKAEQGFAGVVGTVMSNLGLEQAMARHGIAFLRSKVGDRYVLEKLLENKWILGGEASGHILSLDRSTTGDGLIAALLVISVMAEAKMSLHDLVKDFHKYPQVMVNINFKNNRIDGHDFAANLERPSIKSAVADVEQQLIGRGRLLVRKSGTEPLIRVMVEGENLLEIEKIANKLADLIKSEAVA